MWQLIVKFRITGDHVTEYQTRQQAEEALGRAMRRSAFTGLQMKIEEKPSVAVQA